MPVNSLEQARIRKALEVKGKTLCFRDATTQDASFVHSLRTDAKKSRYLSPVGQALSEQCHWLERYSKQSDQAYFIIEFKNQPIGTVRLYDPRGDSFCWGSWILINERPDHAAVESALMVYHFALDHLGFTSAHFDVRKANERVWRFHERFGAQRVSETEQDLFYRLDQPSIRASLHRYRRYLDGGVNVKFA